MHSRAAARPNPAVKALLFVASVMLAGAIAWFTFGNSDAGLILFFCPLLCTLPIFAVLTWTLRKKGNLGTVLPLLVLPLLFILFFTNMIYERNPQYMFKTYVADPIPAGVTKIQGRYIREGLFEDVVITFQASPEAIDTIITKKQFERATIEDNHIDPDLPEHLWKGNWIGYERRLLRSDGALEGYIDMWIDTEQSIVIFRYRI